LISSEAGLAIRNFQTGKSGVMNIVATMMNFHSKIMQTKFPGQEQKIKGPHHFITVKEMNINDVSVNESQGVADHQIGAITGQALILYRLYRENKEERLQ
jgi:hypothetical protein